MKHSTLTTSRRLSQIFFLALFLLLLLRTELRGSLHATGDVIRLPYPVQLFFQLDPLVAISNALASHALYRGLLWSLLVLVPTFFFGRFFCGWICPMGTLNHYFSSLKSESKRGKQLIDSNRYKSWQTTKYYLLIAVLLASFFGSGLVGWLDPFSLLTRSFGLSFIPAANYAVSAALKSIEHVVAVPLQFLIGIIHLLLNATILSFKQPQFRQGFFLGLLFLSFLLLNFRVTRFWCRAICPLGALLGVASRWSILGLQKNHESCDDCNRCLLHCQGGDNPVGGVPWHKSECHLCLNCLGECPHHGLAFKFFPTDATAVIGPNLKRRQALTSIAAGAALIPLLRSTSAFSVEKNERLLRPPGALEESDFLARCIRCGECMKVCPNNALQPSFAQAGIEGVWTPVLVPRIGYCESSCVLCSQVCPTGAIWEITPKSKGWTVDLANDTKPIRIGTAFYDRGRCLPWAMATDCIVCEEWCPTSPKAIYMRPAEVIDAAANPKQLQQPWVNPAQCVGCGACEYACPIHEHPAVYVLSIGETRSKTNQILLNRTKEKPAS
ncbi:MAG TPA: 4Fe-4S binding protein [Candidatus Acidoferrum sp.]